MDIQRVRELHPCFGARQNRGRIHLPVCPGCNIECRFCDRTQNDVEMRPGVTSRVIEPEEAVAYVEKARRFCPEISVVGIAGPGDTLASDRAIETFKAIGSRFPDLLTRPSRRTSSAASSIMGNATKGRRRPPS